MTKDEFKARRKAKGLTQQQLADLVGTHIRTIQKFEYGDTDLDRMEVRTAYKIAKIFEIEMADLVE